METIGKKTMDTAIRTKVTRAMIRVANITDKQGLSSYLAKGVILFSSW